MFEWLKKQEEPAKPLLDTAFLDRLAAHLGRDVTRELMADGLIELSDRLHRLKVLADENDIAEIAKLAHDLAGMAGHLGLSRMSQLSVDVNRLARDGEVDSARGLVSPVLDVAPLSLDALRTYLDAGTGTDVG